MKSGKQIVTVLLLLACILSGIILAATPPFVPKKITTNAELDSLILLSLHQAGFRSEQIRTYPVAFDSTFSRKVYRVRIAPSYSKTSLHIAVHQQFYPYGFDTPARVTFPEKDMNIYFTYQGTVLRTIRLITDNSLPREEALEEDQDE